MRQIVDSGFGAMLRVGVNRGYVFAGDVGPPYRRTYTVMGDAVNLAARLMTRAGDGEIVVSPDVLSLARDAVRSRANGAVPGQGKAKPVTAFKLGGRRNAREAVAR